MASVLASSAADTSSLKLDFDPHPEDLSPGATHSPLADHYNTELALTHTLLLKALAKIIPVVSCHM